MSSQASPGDFNADSGQPSVNNHVMVAAVIVLFVLVFFVLCLHIYAKWLWRGPTVFRNLSWRGQPAAYHTSQEAVGLNKEVTDSLPTFTYQNKSVEGNDTAIMECAVCLYEFEGDEKGTMLPRCKHVFHTQCIHMWFSSHSTCPLCRTPVVEEMLSPSPTSTNGELQRPASISNGPSNVLVWANHDQAGYQLGPPSSASTSPVSQISIQIPAQSFHESTTPTSQASTPLESSARNREFTCKTADGQGTSSSQCFRSPSFGNSIKRLLSRGRSRTAPSEEEREQASTTVATTIPVSNSLPA